ncbi:MAG: DUF3293 domain-containing protein [Gemmatimonadaceae bacterium]
MSDPATDWGDFPRTVLHFLSESPFALDLQANIRDTELAALEEAGFEHTFCIVTAQDPMGIEQPPETNAMLVAKLEADVAQLKAHHVEVDACSPDSSHCEQSMAVDVDLEVAVSLASRYDQLAIFWFDGATFWIVPARSSKSRLRLPVRR